MNQTKLVLSREVVSKLSMDDMYVTIEIDSTRYGWMYTASSLITAACSLAGQSSLGGHFINILTHLDPSHAYEALGDFLEKQDPE